MARVLAPTLASTGVSAGLEEQVRRLDARNPHCLRSVGAATLGTLQEYSVAYNAVASGSLLAARGGGKAFSEGKQALVDMAKRDKRTGISPDDMQAYMDLNAELPDPFPSNAVRGPEAHMRGGPHSQQPHGHVGPVQHIPIIEPPPVP